MALGYERWPRPRRPHRRVLWRRPCRQSRRLEFLSQRSLAAGCALPVRAEGCHHEKLPKHTHAASTYGTAPARRTRPWIPYGPSEQSRWAPQLGQRSWQACMSIIVCPHMGHSFFLPTAIHHMPRSASYYSFWQTRRLRPWSASPSTYNSPPASYSLPSTTVLMCVSSGLPVAQNMLNRVSLALLSVCCAESRSSWDPSGGGGEGGYLWFGLKAEYPVASVYV